MACVTGWEILQRLWQLHRAVLRDAAPHLQAHGVPPVAVFVLARVAEHPSPSALARALGLPRPTLSHLLRRLERRGWVRREPDPADLRRFRLSLTEAGRAALAAARAALGQALEARLRRLAAGQRQELARLLDALLADPGE